MKKIGEIFAASLLIAGTAIGVGILGLPIQVGMVGLLPACIGLLTGIILMYTSGMVLAETYVQARNKNADFPSLVEHVLGKPGKYLIIIGYLIVFWGILIAYYTAGSSILANILPFKLPPWVLIFIFFSPITIMLLFGLKYVLRFNTAIMIFLIISFFILLLLCSEGIQLQRYHHTDWSYFLGALPIILCTVAFQNTIPAICHRFQGNIKHVRLSIICGLSLIGLICLLWTVTVIGSLPLTGANSISSALAANQPATIPLTIVLHSRWVTLTGLCFAIAAITTSYISISIGMLRFFGDLFSSTSKQKRDTLAILLTFIPPLTVSIICPNIFLKAMDVVGGVGVVILFGITPSLILIKQNKTRRTLILGIVALAAFLAILGLEIAQESGILKISQHVENWKNHH